MTVVDFPVPPNAPLLSAMIVCPPQRQAPALLPPAGTNAAARGDDGDDLSTTATPQRWPRIFPGL